MVLKYSSRTILITILFLWNSSYSSGSPLPFIASKGLSNSKVELSWKYNSGEPVSVLKSEKESGPFAKIAFTNAGRYTDRNVEAGVKYWYRISDQTAAILASDYGYTKPPAPRGLMPDEIIKSRTKPLPRPLNEEMQARWDRHLSVMNDYYENYITVSIIIYIGKIYILRGDLVAFRDFSDYTIDYFNKTINVKKDGMNPIKFHSKRLFRFLKRCDKNLINELEILPRLVNNAIFFCVRRDNDVQTGPDGKTRMVPVFEALGMSTEYFRDNGNWRSSTIVFGSDTKDLDELIEKNRKKK